MQVVDKTPAVLPSLSARPTNFTAGGYMLIFRGALPMREGWAANRWTSADAALEVMSRVEAGLLRVTIFQKYRFPKPEVGVSVADAFFGRVKYRAVLVRDGALCGYNVEQVAPDAGV